MNGNILYIYMNGQFIGELTKTKQKLSLKYDESWISLANSRPISLSLPLTESIISGPQLDNYLKNLLPDNSNILNRIRRRFSLKSTHHFDLLQAIGKDCVGAIQLLTEKMIPNIKVIDSTPVNDDQIEEILNIASGSASPIINSIDTEQFRISIAGAQEKTALLKLNKEWHLPQKHTPTTHIFKLPIGQHGFLDLSESVENEWLCHLILKSFGLPIANCEIGLFNQQKALIVERFDRKFSQDNSWIIRLPQEDLCQVHGVNPDNKYESDGGIGIKEIMGTLRGSNNSKTDRYNFLKSQIAFWMLAAIDGHAKNFSIFIKQQGRYESTPLYDVMSAYPLLNKKNNKLQAQKIKMAMAAIGKNKQYHWCNILSRHWYSTAKSCQFNEGKLTYIIEELCDNVETTIDSVSNLIPNGFPEHIAESIFKGLKNSRNKLA